MIFRKENGRYEGVMAKGKVVRFEDRDEMIKCIRKRRELSRLLGKKAENTVSIIRKHKPSAEKKKIRITIDPDVEYFGKEKALA